MFKLAPFQVHLDQAFFEVYVIRAAYGIQVEEFLCAYGVKLLHNEVLLTFAIQRLHSHLHLYNMYLLREVHHRLHHLPFVR